MPRRSGVEDGASSGDEGMPELLDEESDGNSYSRDAGYSSDEELPRCPYHQLMRQAQQASLLEEKARMQRLEEEEAGMLDLAEAEEEAAVARGEVQAEVLARCQAYVADARVADFMTFTYCTTAAHRIVRDEAAAWGLEAIEEPWLSGGRPRIKLLVRCPVAARAEVRIAEPASPLSAIKSAPTAADAAIQTDVPAGTPFTERSGAEAGKCVICLCSTDDEDAGTLVRCSGAEPHAICSGCFGMYVEDCVAKLKATDLLASKAETAEAEGNRLLSLRLAGRITCPLSVKGGGCACEEPFDNRLIALHVSAETFDSYTKGLALLPAAISVKDALQRGAELRALFPNARMCARCRYGPVEHAGCSSLLTHHGESLRRVDQDEDDDDAPAPLLAPAPEEAAAAPAPIDNACPACGWLATDISEWLPWDGVSRALGSGAEAEAAPYLAGAPEAQRGEEDEAAEAARRRARHEELRRFREQQQERWNPAPEMDNRMRQARERHDIIFHDFLFGLDGFPEARRWEEREREAGEGLRRAVQRLEAREQQVQLQAMRPAPRPLNRPLNRPLVDPPNFARVLERQARAQQEPPGDPDLLVLPGEAEQQPQQQEHGLPAGATLAEAMFGPGHVEPGRRARQQARQAQHAQQGRRGRRHGR